MSKREICIIHFNPIEKYPPVCNLLKMMGAYDTERNRVHVVSFDPGPGINRININGINIYRLPHLRHSVSRLSRFIGYMRFIFVSLMKLISLKPGSVLYYETLSAGGPCIYKMFFSPSCRLFIHYHEYTSPEEYASGMIFNRWLHKLEMSLYKKAFWISHTNSDRMNFFKMNNGIISASNIFLLPNYPPEDWCKDCNIRNLGSDDRIGFIFVGSLSIQSMFIKEISNYISKRPDECYLDIYSHNVTKDVLEFLTTLGADNISFKESVNYENLPSVLQNYQIGLVLYKGDSLNSIYTVPNKFYEYYVCGLDVWFPLQLLTALPLVTKTTYPKVIAIDFEHLEQMNLKEKANRANLRYNKIEYNCADIYETLIDFLVPAS